MNWNQLKTVFWLRWRLVCNQSSRSGGLGVAIAILIGAGAAVLATAAFTGALLLGVFGLARVPPLGIMGVWAGVTIVFLLFWMIGLLAELQRSETIDLQRLMHLPVALGQMFLINYLVSHFTLSIILFVPAMVGLALGLTIARGPEMMLLIPLALGMVFMVTAWTYCLRGWLATLMTNPRRRRTVIMLITIGFILLGQGPNLYFNVINRQTSHSQQQPDNTPEDQRRIMAQTARAEGTFHRLIAAQRFIPPLWVAVGAQGLAEGRVWPAMLGTLGGLGLGALGLRRAYRATVRYYHGQTGARTAARSKPAGRTDGAGAGHAGGRSRFLELQLPGVPEPAAALALATFRSMLRAPEVKMAWATSFLVTLIAGASLFFRSAPTMPEAAKPFLATGTVVFSVFMLVQFFANQFGFDRDGFRALILSPADRRLVLLGKNLACAPVGAGFGLVLLGLISLRLHLPLSEFAAVVLQLVALLLFAGLAGNVLSILVPYRIQAGSLKPTKMPGLAMLMMFLSHMFFPVVMTPVFLSPLAGLLWRHAGLPSAVPVNFIFSVLLAVVAVILYWQTLAPLGRLLHRRETKILSVVTVEVE
jgi:ABC-2 type transport system permease protein